MKVGQSVYFRGVHNETLEGRIFNIGESLLRIAVYTPIDDPPGRELTYHIMEDDDVMLAEVEDVDPPDLKHDPNSYISQSDVHSLIYMIQAGDAVSAVEMLRTWISGPAKSDHIRHMPTQNLETMKELHRNKTDISEEQFYHLMAPTRVAITPLDFGCNNVDIMTLVDRHAPNEALRIVVDAAERYNRRSVASRGHISGVLIDEGIKHWVLHTGNFTEHFLGQPPSAYVEFPSALALQQAVRCGRSTAAASSDTMRPQSKARPSSRPTAAASDPEPGQGDDTPGAPICKHWVMHMCNFAKCKYSHTGPGGKDPRGSWKRRRRS